MPKPRKSRSLIPEKTMKIFCEGAKTEPLYINGYLQMLENSKRKTVITVEKSNKNTPVQLVEAAIRAKTSRDALPDDEFWVVYDREGISKYPDPLHEKARQKASGKNINVALSNICFEYWLLIHLIDTQAPYSCYDELRKKSPLNAEIEKLTGDDYDKSSSKIFNMIKEKIPQARARGAKLNKDGRDRADNNRNKDHHINPYMGMVDLLDAIDKFR